MHNALFIATFVEGATEEQRSAAAEAVQAPCAALSDVYIATTCPADSSTNAGDIYCELAFDSREAYDAAKQNPAWTELEGILNDPEVFSACEFAGYGPGELKLGEGTCTCHRVMVVRLAEGADPERIDNMCKRLMVVDTYVPGLVNMQISPVFESSGSGQWDYVYDCDFDEPATYLGPYMRSPYHWGYLRLAQSDTAEYVMARQLSPYVVTEEAFLPRMA